MEMLSWSTPWKLVRVTGNLLLVADLTKPLLLKLYSTLWKVQKKHFAVDVRNTIFEMRGDVIL